jgi:hypothetical protein
MALPALEQIIAILQRVPDVPVAEAGPSKTLGPIREKRNVTF